MSALNTLTCEQKRQHVVEKMWLNYYNNVLFGKGLITEIQYNKMKTKINARKLSTMVQ